MVSSSTVDIALDATSGQRRRPQDESPSIRQLLLDDPAFSGALRLESRSYISQAHDSFASDASMSLVDLFSKLADQTSLASSIPSKETSSSVSGLLLSWELIMPVLV